MYTYWNIICLRKLFTKNEINSLLTFCSWSRVRVCIEEIWKINSGWGSNPSTAIDLTMLWEPICLIIGQLTHLLEPYKLTGSLTNSYQANFRYLNEKHGHKHITSSNFVYQVMLLIAFIQSEILECWKN